MDQLGSGIREVTRYIGAYANGKAAQFIEGDMFRTIIPLDDRLMSAMVTPSIELASSDKKSKETTAVLINVPINVLLSGRFS